MMSRYFIGIARKRWGDLPSATVRAGFALSRQEASQPSRRSSHIAGDLFLLAFLFLFIFGLTGLFAGV